MTTFELYESVRIKATGVTGIIVAKDTDGDTKPPIFFVEKDDAFKTGKASEDCVWCDSEEIERI